MYCAIPIEIAKRELEGQIYLALHLATARIPTLLGTKEPVERICLEGHGSFILLDKGLGYISPNFSLDSCAPLNDIEPYFDSLLVWGEKQKIIAQQRLPKNTKVQVVVTGYPAFDLLSPKFLPYYFDDKITKKFGEDFILFNSNL